MKRLRRHHLTDREARLLVKGELKIAATQHAVLHLWDGCERCGARLVLAAEAARFWGEHEPEAAYDACLDRAEAALPDLIARWAEEEKCRREGAAVVRSRGWGNLTTEQRGRMRGRWSEVEILIELSFGTRFRDRRGMLRMAKAAVRAASRLEPTEECPEPLLFDLRARAAAELGNAHRVNEAFFPAAQAITEAWELQAKGTGDPLVEARIAEVEASLCKDQSPRRLVQAGWLLDRAHRLYLRAGQRHLAGRALVLKGLTQGVGETASEGVETLRQALTLLEPDRDPQLIAIAHHNLIDALVDAGELTDAGRLLMKADLRRLFERDPLNLLRYHWLEGKLLLARGRFESARAALTEVRNGFRIEGLEYVASVAGIDVCRTFAAEGKARETYAAAKELHARARDKNLPVGAQYALRCWEILCRQGACTAPFAKAIQRFLEEVEHRPWMPFEPEEVLLGA